MDINEQINMIMRQTDYTKEISEEKMREHNNNVMAVIREYMGPSKIINKPVSSKFSVNQQVFKEIRGMMDNAAKTYQKKKEEEEIIKMEMEERIRIKKEYELKKKEALQSQSKQVSDES
jgi:hypothetical protein